MTLSDSRSFALEGARMNQKKKSNTKKHQPFYGNTDEFI